jgi:Carboxypeptidase regulatory-like domain
MKTTLDNIRVASPCLASWEKMTGDDRVRYCQECKLDVYNLSDMNRAEAEHLISSREGRLCVRFYRRADGTILTRDCPKGLRALTARVSRIAAAVLSAMMTVTPVLGQSPAKANSQSQEAGKEAELGLDVTVVDPTNAVIQNARVVMCRCKDKITNDASTGASGVAQFRGLPKGTYEITVQARGFKTRQQTVTIKRTEQIQVKLPIGVIAQTVEVNATTLGVIDVVMGGLIGTTENPLPSIPISAGRPAPLR